MISLNRSEIAFRRNYQKALTNRVSAFHRNLYALHVDHFNDKKWNWVLAKKRAKTNARQSGLVHWFPHSSIAGWQSRTALVLNLSCSVGNFPKLNFANWPKSLRSFGRLTRCNPNPVAFQMHEKRRISIGEVHFNWMSFRSPESGLCSNWKSSFEIFLRSLNVQFKQKMSPTNL